MSSENERETSQDIHITISQNIKGARSEEEWRSTLTPKPPSVIPIVVERDGVLEVDGVRFDLSSIVRIHTPMKTEEVIEAIGEHVKAQMRKSRTFSTNRAFELVVWRVAGEVTWKAYGENRAFIGASGAMILANEEGDVLVGSEGEGGKELVTAVHQDKDMPPDEVRRRTGQGIPVHTGKGKTRVVTVPSERIKE